MTTTTNVEAVPLLDLKRSLPELEPELTETFLRVLRSGHYIGGPEVLGLEAECASYIGAKHAVGVSSGTDALLLALMAYDVGPGDEVISPAYTFFATAGTIWRTGARPALVDVRPCCYNVDPAAVTARIGARTKAIMPVHLFGQCADMKPVLEAAAARKIPVIEDAAQAIGARYAGKGAGTMGAIGCFSFFPSKNLGGMGDGGLVTTEDDALAERCRLLRGHGMKPKYYHAMVGANFRIDALFSALLRVKLRHLDRYTERRQQNAALYTKLLTEAGVAEVQPSICRGEAPAGTKTFATKKAALLPCQCQERHIYNQYTVRVPGEGGRDRVRAHLASKKVDTEIYYPVPMHMQECFASLGHKPGDFPVSEAAARETFALPIFPELSEAEIRYVAAGIVEALTA